MKEPRLLVEGRRQKTDIPCLLSPPLAAYGRMLPAVMLSYLSSPGCATTLGVSAFSFWGNAFQKTRTQYTQIMEISI